MSQALQVVLNMTSGTIRAACAALERRPTDPERLATVLGILRDTADELGAIGRMQQRLAEVLADECSRDTPYCPQCGVPDSIPHKRGCPLGQSHATGVRS